jgi:hypothetical protein
MTKRLQGLNVRSSDSESLTPNYDSFLFGSTEINVITSRITFTMLRVNFFRIKI